MQIEMLKTKVHRGCVTHVDVDYDGSLGIDKELMEAAGLYPHEKVLVANINNGNRFDTYIIPEPYGSRRLSLNGAAARLGSIGDRVILMTFCLVEELDVREGRHQPRLLRLDEHNEPIHWLTTAPSSEEIMSMIEG